MTERYEGSCHCGAISFSYGGEEISAGLGCSCSICARKGAFDEYRGNPAGIVENRCESGRYWSLPVRPEYQKILSTDRFIEVIGGDRYRVDSAEAVINGAKEGLIALFLIDRFR